MKAFKNLSMIHIVLVFLSLLILMIPWYQLGIEFPSFIAGGKIIVDSKYLVVGSFYIIILILNIWESRTEPYRKKELKLLMAFRNASNKILFHGLLILLAYNGFISVMIPVVMMMKDILVEMMKKLSADNGKMMEKSPLGLCEKICMHIGLIFLLFYNLPFELWNLFFADALIMIGTVLSVLNGCIYYFRAKKMLIK